MLRDSGHEHLTGSVVVPIFDGRGNVCELYGRKILGSKLRKGTAQHLYLPGPHAGVWNAEGLEGREEVILCEALIDAMTFWVNGCRNVTASYGTSGFTENHLALFKQLHIKRVLIAYDRDEAGNKAAEALAKKLAKENIDCYRLHFLKSMDANQYALEVMSREGRYADVPGGRTSVTPAAKSLGVVIRSVEWLGEGPPPGRQLDIEQHTGVAATPSLAAADPSEPPAARPDESQGDGQEEKKCGSATLTRQCRAAGP